MNSRLIGFLCIFLGWFRDTSAFEIKTNRFASASYTVCRIDLKSERLQLFLKDDTQVTFQKFDRLASWLNGRGENLVFAMNAGMYHPDYNPVGLYISEGKMVSPLNTSSGYGNFFLKPNGVFVITEKGAQIVETSEFPKILEKPILATQSGPLLLRAGKLHPVLKPGSSSRLIRNGVGIQSSGQVVLVISEVPVNLHEFATLFRDGLHCPDALYLDGVISGLYAPAISRHDKRGDLGPILGVTEKKP